MENSGLADRGKSRSRRGGSTMQIAESPPEMQHPSRGDSGGCDEETITQGTIPTADLSGGDCQDLEPDGLPPMINLGDLLNNPMPPPDLGNDPIERCAICNGELAEPCEIAEYRKHYPNYQPQPPCSCHEDDFDYEAWNNYRNQVERRWNEEDQKEVAFAKNVRTLIENVKDNFKDAKTKEERFQRKQLLWSEIFRVAEKEEEDESFKRAEEIVTIDDLQKFDRHNDPANLLGNRWLCKGSQAAITGPTGVGKSSLVMQAAIRWTLGRPFFGIKPVKPMRILLIQAENDLGDISEEFQDMVDAMSSVKLEPFGNEQIEEIRKRLNIRRVDSITGQRFVNYLERSINEVKPDIIFVDPFLAYVGDDALQQKVMSNFLRVLINPILRKTGVLLIWVHHTVKPGGNANGQEKTAEQNKYAGLGSSDFQNACREIIALSDNGDGTFKLEFAKRGRRTAIVDEKGKPARSINIKWHNKGIAWVRCEGIEAKITKKERKAANDIDEVRAYIKAAGKPVTLEQLQVWAPSKDIGVNRAVNIAKTLAMDKGEGIWAFDDPSKTGKGKKPTLFSATQPPEGAKIHWKERDSTKGPGIEAAVTSYEDDDPIDTQEEVEISL
jgi:hypothetical protein